MSDNGEGIPREDLSLVGVRYATSKCRDLQDLRNSRCFGFHGEALASIVQVAQTVELTSRHRRSQLTYCKRFQAGQDAGITSCPVRGLDQAGTAVTVHNLFYNLPVRRRHMNPSVELERLRRTLCRALLVLPLVSLSLHDNQAGQRLLHVPMACSMLRRFHQLFGARTTGARATGVQHTSVAENGVTISALLSVDVQSGSNLQLLFLNQREVESQRLHVLVCQLLEPIAAQHRTRDKHTRGGSRPFYVIAVDSDIDTPNTHNLFQQEKKMMNALTHLIHSFLSDNHFTPHHLSQSPPVLSTVVPASRERLLSVSTPTATSGPPIDQSASELPDILKPAVHPATRQALYLHPVSGCTHSNLKSPLTTVHFTSSSVQHVACVRVKPALASTATAACSSLLADWRNPAFSAGDGVSGFPAVP